MSVLRPAAKEAKKENPKAVSGTHCKYCPGRSICRRRAEDELKIADAGKKPELMTDEEIEAILPKLDGLIAYAEDVKSYCLKKAIENGKKWKGYKLVESVTKRRISDEMAVAKILTEQGYDPYSPKKLLSISELQKMVGKAQFNNLVGSYIVKPKGQTVLAPESDAREEITVKKGDETKC